MVLICIQFQDIGNHGTKVAIYNLWMNDDGLLELDFDDDDEVNVHEIFHHKYNAILHHCAHFFGSSNPGTEYSKCFIMYGGSEK